ncbi:deoxyribodipyrimidine photolyase-related protein [Dongia mobilis]|uniref:Deoxyribodipyrimidine photolyase-related protein n=1 Tax=Dongia mobilis TaxID=578943 RepID=A0A4R6WZ39_9PROT|nr:cryptochrome/photolyase family protein [Dongia mobilis]TDQ85519.1 deoxyribodipyrimidine photolyase-related protein [Dongia mobilis]
MRALRLVLGDQLCDDIAALRGLDPAQDVVLMLEVAAETTYVPHHKQKLVLVLSAMRHFAAELMARGIRVDYVALDDPANTGSFDGEVARAVARHRPDRLIATFPGEYRVLAMMRGWQGALDLPVEIREDDRFFVTPAAFAGWAEGRRELRQEHFYRRQRMATGLLMENDKPAGGSWNFDRANRKPWPRGKAPPTRRRFPPDAITREVMALVADRFAGHFGTLDEFAWGVTRADALLALDDFIELSLPHFGDHQDAMLADAPFLHHGLLSPYLNLGLLGPREVCARAVSAYRAGRAPINAVEGFIRQILGWREYVRGIYWHFMPDYAATNALAADEPLPDFYWSGETAMACVADTVRGIAATGYAHHIQRLMVTGNLALLWGVRPAEIEAWYLSVFVDAFDWVELPNTHGMAIHADGGIMTSKPYSASGAYIARMSNYCGQCRYDPKRRHGPDACPMTTLYWDFLARHRARFAAHPRLRPVMLALDRLPAAELAAIRTQATALRRRGSDLGPDDLGPGERGALAPADLFDRPNISRPASRASRRSRG